MVKPTYKFIFLKINQLFIQLEDLIFITYKKKCKYEEVLFVAERVEL